MVLKKRQLGKTDIEITAIGLGVMQFSGNGLLFRSMLSEVPEGETNIIVKTALDGGINWFDTAEMYGRGHSEQSLAEALSAAGTKDEDVIIGTKWFPFLRTARNIPRTIENRLRFLEGYTIDLYMIHQPISFSSPEASVSYISPIETNRSKGLRFSRSSFSRNRRNNISNLLFSAFRASGGASIARRGTPSSDAAASRRRPVSITNGTPAIFDGSNGSGCQSGSSGHTRMGVSCPFEAILFTKDLKASWDIQSCRRSVPIGSEI